MLRCSVGSKNGEYETAGLLVCDKKCAIRIDSSYPMRCRLREHHLLCSVWVVIKHDKDCEEVISFQ